MGRILSPCLGENSGQEKFLVLERTEDKGNYLFEISKLLSFKIALFFSLYYLCPQKVKIFSCLGENRGHRNFFLCLGENRGHTNFFLCLGENRGHKKFLFFF